jgi:hypothetical protein
MVVVVVVVMIANYYVPKSILNPLHKLSQVNFPNI